MPENEPNTNEPDGAQPKPDGAPSNDSTLADKLVAQIAESNAKLAEALSKRDTPAPDKPGDDYDKRVTEFRSRHSTAKKRAAELMAEGKYEEAITEIETIGPPPQATVDPAQNPILRGLRDDAVESVRAENDESKWLFEQYADEIEKAVDALPVEKRATRNGIRTALKQVKAQHIDEVADRRVTQTIETREREAREMPPQNVPVPLLGETRDTKLHGLTTAEREFAHATGIDYEAYAKSKKAIDEQAFSGQGIPLT